MATARGSFEVTMAPADGDGAVGPVTTMTLEKTLTGDFVGDGVGSMLAYRTEVEGSAAYVALERLTGFLEGLEGGFAAQHTGVMQGGDGQLTITIVPDSGTGGLTGISGSMTIDVDGAGTHTYVIDYELP